MGTEEILNCRIYYENDLLFKDLFLYISDSGKCFSFSVSFSKNRILNKN